MKEKRRLEKIKNTFKDWLHEEKLKIYHPSDIPAWFLDNQQTIMDAWNAGCRPIDTFGCSGEDKFYNTDKFENVKFTGNSVFQDLLSNTHSCPDNGTTNFMRDPDKPRGYPGWSAYIKGALIRNKKHNGSYPYSGALKLVGLKTGTGGGGNADWGYSVSIFLADWPGLEAEYASILHERYLAEELRIINRLKGK